MNDYDTRALISSNALINARPMLDTTTGAIVRRGDLTPSQLYERGKDGDQYRYQPILPT